MAYKLVGSSLVKRSYIVIHFIFIQWKVGPMAKFSPVLSTVKEILGVWTVNIDSGFQLHLWINYRLSVLLQQVI